MSFTPHMPAISDADLARLLAAGNSAPPLPAGLMDRIMSGLPAEPIAARPETTAAAMPLPPAAAHRHTAQRQPQRRWLRSGLGIGTSLLVASAVAAGLAQTPLLRPVVGPILASLADLAGAGRQPTTRAPIVRAAPLPAAAAAPPFPLVVPPATVPQLQASLPPSAITPPAPLALQNLPMPMPERLLPRSGKRATTPPREARVPRPGLAAKVEAAAQLPARPAIAAALHDRPAPAEPLTERLADRLPARRSEQPPAPAVAAPREAIALPPQMAPDLPSASDGPVAPPDVAASAAAIPDTQANRAAIVAQLREAQKAGTLTTEQAQRLRALRQLRAIRTGRDAGGGARRRP